MALALTLLPSTASSAEAVSLPFWTTGWQAILHAKLNSLLRASCIYNGTNEAEQRRSLKKTNVVVISLQFAIICG